MKVLVRATNWVGDAVMSLPAIRAIRRAFPGWEVVLLARPWVAGLYARESSIDRVILLEGRGWPARLRTVRAVAAERCDAAILLQNAFEAALIARLAGIPRRIGYRRDGRGWLLTDAIAVPHAGELPAHERFYYLELLRRAGLIAEIPETNQIRLEGSAEAAAAGRNRLAALGVPLPVVGVSPGAAYGTAKRWLPESFAVSAVELARHLGGSVAIFGSAGERPLCEQVNALVKAEKIPVANLAGRTALEQFIEMAAACVVFLTNDSGAMHIASALGVPTVTVFGATNHVTTGPTGANAAIVREPVDCSPCLLRECPIDHRCMTRVPPSRVVDEALHLIGGSSR
ncbi:MAG: lipopolysaccharide heptosyltransferase II [Bryobacterales bacterium]|nr:lipopolysaccharide heptosyltransferase II [Bryobacterales bacterium]